MFSKKTTKIDEIFTVDLTVTTYCQIDGEDFVNFCGLLRKRELYKNGPQAFLLSNRLIFLQDLQAMTESAFFTIN